MPGSALIWNSYRSAFATGVHAKDGRNWKTAPLAGATCTGLSIAPRAGPAVRKVIAAKAAARSLRSAAIECGRRARPLSFGYHGLSRTPHRGKTAIGHPSDEGTSSVRTEVSSGPAANDPPQVATPDY